MSTRSEPKRGPLLGSGSDGIIPGNFASTRSTDVAAKAVDAAYRVIEEYVEDGRRYAEGRSAWFGSDLFASPSRGANSAASDPRVLLEIWRTVAPLIQAAGGLSPFAQAVASAVRGLSGQSDRNAEPAASQTEATPAMSWVPWQEPPARSGGDVRQQRDPGATSPPAAAATSKNVVPADDLEVLFPTQRDAAAPTTARAAGGMAPVAPAAPSTKTTAAVAPQNTPTPMILAAASMVQPLAVTPDSLATVAQDSSIQDRILGALGRMLPVTNTTPPAAGIPLLEAIPRDLAAGSGKSAK